ncbi:N-acyl-D-amino-acid deacylase family protein [Pseudoalteromonas denitrificans]|uniref:N-acyl-D-aspartate/D-glutamate deacylase n=1 Tax=Pseudoalteromonas denitrificans DSM 6059 TaxID=1123010 RepID=A0A1I1NB76_9GAMM|nr:amidohydrolase family protein [Pseudoalteromonas denitrificans]SFC94931.1 N-acyl-D-aspartate/D-glutamate deacylase [Pseudoalteromonas denitrificans DSM 6059]
MTLYKKNKNMRLLTLVTVLLGLVACLENNINTQDDEQQLNIDVLIKSGTVFTGTSDQGQKLDIAVCEQIICGLYASNSKVINAKKVIDAKGKIVSPGFIDAHTHTLEELMSSDKNSNLNYLTQGVTTVVNGNDGGGPVDFLKTKLKLEKNGIGTNTALLVGHGELRDHVIGRAERFAKPEEISQMKALLNTAMKQGAIGLSSGLYYVPGAFADTNEVVELAKTAAKYKGIYDTHLRDESTFNIGFKAAVSEAIEIAKLADIHLHIAHIKALGVDVWGQSTDVIKQIETAQQQGISISADQYPWQASGTMLTSAVVPKWVMADSQKRFHGRLNNHTLLPKIKIEITENIRRRGGGEALLVTVTQDRSLVGKTLKQIAKDMGLSETDTVISLVQGPQIRIASFNMSNQDIENFMVKPWVVTSSDGTNGHPRKYASFPKKYRQYVKEQKLLTLAQFIKQSSSQTAKILNLEKRGEIKLGHYADIIVFDENKFSDKANFKKWNVLSTGIETVLINGALTIENGQYNQVLNGKVVH